MRAASGYTTECNAMDAVARVHRRCRMRREAVAKRDGKKKESERKCKN